MIRTTRIGCSDVQAKVRRNKLFGWNDSAHWPKVLPPPSGCRALWLVSTAHDHGNAVPLMSDPATPTPRLRIAGPNAARQVSHQDTHIGPLRLARQFLVYDLPPGRSTKTAALPIFVADAFFRSSPYDSSLVLDLSTRCCESHCAPSTNIHTTATL